MRGRLLMGATIDYLDTWSVTLFATLTGYRMIEFAVQICPAMVGCVNVGFSVIIDKSVNIRIRGDFKVFVNSMFMPNREIDMEIRWERVILDEFHRHVETLCVQVESETWVQQSEGNPHFKFLQIFDVTALVDTHNIETLCAGQLTVQVSKHLRRTGAKPYRVDSMTVQGSLWITEVRLVYIAVFGAIVAVLTSATYTFFKPRDIQKFRTFEG